MTGGIRNPVRWVDIRRDMTPIERYFACCLSRGLPCQLGDTVPKEPTSGNTIRAEVIRFFAYGGSNEHPVLGPAIHLEGAWIYGAESPLDLTHADIRYALRFFHCHFVDCVEMIGLKCPALYMPGSHLAKGLQAAELRTDGPVHLCKGFVADGKVDLSRAYIGGDLNCINGKFNGQGAQALMANLATVKGAMFMHSGFSAEGEVRLLNARVDGDFDCKGGRFNNLRGNALSADGMAVGGNVFLNKSFFAKGQVKLPQAQIGGDLDCSGGRFHEPTECALNAFGATLGGNMFLCGGFVADGQVNISDANIGGHLDCIAGRFHKPEGDALTASRVTTSGDMLFCKNFFAEGQVDISGANVGGNLDCAGGRFDNLGNYALNAELMVTRGHVFLNKYERRGGDRPFFACGRVRFANADVGRNFNCKGGRFYQPGKKSAIAAAGLRTRGAVFLSEGFSVDGNVDLNVAQIEGNFVCEKCDPVENINGLSSTKAATVDGNPMKSIIDLSSTKAAAVDDDPESWKQFKFILDGFTYDAFYGDSPTGAKSRLEWLDERPEKICLKNGKMVELPFSPLPYEQAATVLFRMGHAQDAREILLEKERRYTEDKRTTQPRKFLRQLWDVFAGYGYRLLWTSCWMVSFVAVGAFLFWVAALHNQIAPHQSAILVSTKYQEALHENTSMKAARAAFPAEYPDFTPLAFSLDVFIPLFALHQEPFWAPASGEKDDLWKVSILLVFMLAMWAALAWLIWAFQDWVRRAQNGIFGWAGPAGVAMGMAVVCLALGFDFLAGLVVFMLAMWAALAWLIWAFQDWVGRAQNSVFGWAGPAGVATGMVAVYLALEFDFSAKFVNALFDFKAWLLADWHWLTAWYWVEIVAGWILTSLFLLSIASLLRPRQSSSERD